MLQNLREIAPTFYLAAPRSWDNLLTRIQVRIEDSSWLKKALYEFFMASALAAEKRKLDGHGPALKQRFLRPLGEWLVSGPIKDQFGLTRTARRLYRRRGDGRGHLRVLPGARHQAASALRPD